jgi:hypothetical protein
MGLLAAKSPLRALRFEDCMLTPSFLPQLCLLTSCTALHLHDIVQERGPPLQLDLLKVCLAADCGHHLTQRHPTMHNGRPAGAAAHAASAGA